MLMFDAKFKTTPVICLSFDLERVGCQGIRFYGLKYEKRTQNQIGRKQTKPDVSCAGTSCRPGVFSEFYDHVLCITACGWS